MVVQVVCYVQCLFVCYVQGLSCLGFIMSRLCRVQGLLCLVFVVSSFCYVQCLSCLGFVMSGGCCVYGLLCLGFVISTVCYVQCLLCLVLVCLGFVCVGLVMAPIPHLLSTNKNIFLIKPFSQKIHVVSIYSGCKKAVENWRGAPLIFPSPFPDKQEKLKYPRF